MNESMRISRNRVAIANIILLLLKAQRNHVVLMKTLLRSPYLENCQYEKWPGDLFHLQSSLLNYILRFPNASKFSELSSRVGRLFQKSNLRRSWADSQRRKKNTRIPHSRNDWNKKFNNKNWQVIVFLLYEDQFCSLWPNNRLSPQSSDPFNPQTVASSVNEIN